MRSPDAHGALAFLNRDRGLRITGEPGRKPRGQELSDRRCVGQQANGAAHGPRELTHPTLHPRHLGADQPRMMQQRVAGFRQCHAASTAVQQSHLARCFHLAQAFAGGWQRQSGLGCAVGDAKRRGRLNRNALGSRSRPLERAIVGSNRVGADRAQDPNQDVGIICDAFADCRPLPFHCPWAAAPGDHVKRVPLHT